MCKGKKGERIEEYKEEQDGNNSKKFERERKKESVQKCKVKRYLKEFIKEYEKEKKTSDSVRSEELLF